METHQVVFEGTLYFHCSGASVSLAVSGCRQVFELFVDIFPLGPRLFSLNIPAVSQLQVGLR